MCKGYICFASWPTFTPFLNQQNLFACVADGRAKQSQIQPHLVSTEHSQISLVSTFCWLEWRKNKHHINIFPTPADLRIRCWLTFHQCLRSKTVQRTGLRFVSFSFLICSIGKAMSFINLNREKEAEALGSILKPKHTHNSFKEPLLLWDNMVS